MISWMSSVGKSSGREVATMGRRDGLERSTRSRSLPARVFVLSFLNNTTSHDNLRGGGRLVSSSWSLVSVARRRCLRLFLSLGVDTFWPMVDASASYMVCRKADSKDFEVLEVLESW